jgi:hypothetical protein
MSVRNRMNANNALKENGAIIMDVGVTVDAYTCDAVLRGDILTVLPSLLQCADLRW